MYLLTASLRKGLCPHIDNDTQCVPFNDSYYRMKDLLYSTHFKLLTSCTLVLAFLS